MNLGTKLGVAACVVLLTLGLVACTPSVVPPIGASARTTKGDGAPVKIGDDLAALYAEYVAFLATDAASEGADAFVPRDASLRVVAGRVAVDALAMHDAERLERELTDVGLIGGSRFGSVVSGFLPILALYEAADLPSMRSMLPTRMETR